MLLIYIGPQELNGAEERRQAVKQLEGSVLTVADSEKKDEDDMNATAREKLSADLAAAVVDAPASPLAKASIYAFRGLSAMFLLTIFMLLLVGSLAPIEMPTVKRTADAWEVLNATIQRTSTLEFRINDFEVPSARTTYTCQSFTLPSHSNYHSVSYEVEAGVAAVVHHAVVFACFKPMPDGFWECPAMPEACVQMIYPWALGAAPFVYPEEAGEMLGRNTGTLNLAVQVRGGYL